jgi:hypothetical protein
MMTRNVIISELDALMCIVVSRENQDLWGINWYQRMYNTIAQVLHKPRLL